MAPGPLSLPDEQTTDQLDQADCLCQQPHHAPRAVNPVRTTAVLGHRPSSRLFPAPGWALGPGSAIRDVHGLQPSGVKQEAGGDRKPLALILAAGCPPPAERSMFVSVSPGGRRRRLCTAHAPGGPRRHLTNNAGAPEMLAGYAFDTDERKTRGGRSRENAGRPSRSILNSMRLDIKPR